MASSQFNQSYRQVMVSGVPTPLSTGTFKDLAAEQIGLFSLAENGTIKVADGTEEKLVLAQGTADYTAKGKTYGGGFSNAPRKTKEFSPENITSFKGIKSNRNHQGQIVALGYDGVDASKTLTALLDVKDLRINVRLWGNLIQKVTGNRKTLTIPLYINKGCLSNGCDVNSIVAGETIADSLIKQIEASYLTTGYKLTDLVQVRKVKKYAVEPAAATGLIPFHKFTVSVFDDGSNAALGLIQSQYPGKVVTRESRTGTSSVYQVWTQDTFTTVYAPTVPASVSLAARTIANCETCPSGSTKLDSVKAYELKGLASVAAPVIAGGTVSLVGNSGVSRTYIVTFADTVVDATIIAAGVALGYTTKLISITRDICNFTAATYTWSNVGSANKAPADWKITIADTECGTDRLAELQANYPGFTVSLDVNGNCANTYKLTNYSEPVEPGCYPDDYKYIYPSAFENKEWVKFTTTLVIPVCTETTSTSPCIAVGVVFESKIEENFLVDDYTYGYYGYDQNRIDPVHIEISVQSLDQNSNACDEPTYPVTKLQSILLPRGEGRFIMERERESLGYEMHKWSTNPLVNKAFGFTWNAKDGKFYDEYQIGITHTWKQGGFSQDSKDSYLVSVFFEEGQGKQFESLINGVIAKNSLKIKQVYL